ncbi:hypothetical protein AYJ54_24110 [Bradyrhizobium centrolobii]|uniref:Uncharacterized protein n=1 Tax=Bradyrhizobium centrolobii TaxID=1505087 RepID=A0A176YFR3_9BRAD|nr:hypothetical protein AYJ54_24110 [Bradyrhizobium centrolobii]
MIRYVISEEDARQRIAELKQERLRVEAELAALEETPTPISLHPATLDRYIETVNALADTIASHASAEDDHGPLVADLCTASSSTRKALGKALRSRSRESRPHWWAEGSFRRATIMVGHGSRVGSILAAQNTRSNAVTPPLRYAFKDRPIERGRPAIAGRTGMDDQAAHCAPDIVRNRPFQERRDDEVGLVQRHALADDIGMHVELDRDLLPRSLSSRCSRCVRR